MAKVLSSYRFVSVVFVVVVLVNVQFSFAVLPASFVSYISFFLPFFFLATFFLACSKRSDSGERCEVKKAMKNRGGLGTPPSLLFFRPPFYLAPLPAI